MRVLPGCAGKTAPRRPRLKSYSFFIDTPPECVDSESHEALLGGRFVRDRDREDVVKYAHRTGEPDSVFAKIDRFLGGVPLGPHGILYAQVYIRSTSVSGRQEPEPFARAPRS